MSKIKKSGSQAGPGNTRRKTRTRGRDPGPWRPLVLPFTAEEPATQDKVRSSEVIKGALESWLTKGAKDWVFRWTVDRLDRAAGVIRIESVPMRRQVVVSDLGKVLEAALVNGIEDREWWDTSVAVLLHLPLDEFREPLEELGLKSMAPLTENMVFWIHLPAKVGATCTVYHMTRAARNLAKELYETVTATSVE